MRRFPTTAAAVLILPLLAGAQANDGKKGPTPTYDGGVNQVLESIFIPPMANAPFTLSLHTEWIKYMADGGTMTVENQRRIARQGTGRFYQERWLLVPKGGNVKSLLSHVQIADPNDHSLVTCAFGPNYCRTTFYGGSTAKVYRPVDTPSGSLPNGEGTVTREDLGKQTMLGVETVGTRITTTITALVLGNDRPFSITREYWFAPSLGVNLISKISDPRFGSQVFTVTDLTLGEPDPQLFDTPEGFRKEDARPAPPAQ